MSNKERVCPRCGRSDGNAWVIRIDLKTGKQMPSEHVTCKPGKQEKAVS